MRGRIKHSGIDSQIFTVLPEGEKMNRTRKVFLVIMACVTLLFATACGKKDAPKFKHGTWSGNTYSSEFLGLKIQVSSDWSISSDAELAKSVGISDMSESSIRTIFDKGGYITDMYALDDYGASINITVQDNSNTMQLNEEEFLDAGIAALESEYKRMGVDLKASKGSVSFLGKSAKCIELEAKIEGETLYGIQIPIINKPFYSAVTLGSFDKSELDKFLGWITAL